MVSEARADVVVSGEMGGDAACCRKCQSINARAAAIKQQRDIIAATIAAAAAVIEILLLHGCHCC